MGKEKPSSRPATAKKALTKGSLFDDSSDSDGATAPPSRPAAEKAVEVAVPRLERVQVPEGVREKQLEVEAKEEEPVSVAEEEEEDEMSKPVLKSFDAGFGDRLAAAIKQGPVMRGVS